MASMAAAHLQYYGARQSLRQKNAELLTENFYVFAEPRYEKHTKKLLDFFPEILENIEE